MAVASFDVRLASDVTQLAGGDVCLDDEKRVAQLRVKSQKNDKFGARQVANLVTMDS